MLVVSRLPPNYKRDKTLDLLRNTFLLLSLIPIGSFVLLGMGWVGLKLALLIRPSSMQILLPQNGEMTLPSNGLVFIIPLVWITGIVFSAPITIILHELIHGLFFWIFTTEMPRFGYRGLLFYTAPPDGLYFSRNPYLVITLAPFGLITILGLLLLLFVPINLLAALISIIALNASGSIGDVAVALWLLPKPSTILIEDQGTRIVTYAPNISKLKINDLPQSL